MTDREIRAYLRGATAAKVLSGWYSPVLGSVYIVSPPGSDTQTFFFWEAITYCEMLRESGVVPVYRESEPILG